MCFGWEFNAFVWSQNVMHSMPGIVVGRELLDSLQDLQFPGPQARQVPWRSACYGILAKPSCTDEITCNVFISWSLWTPAVTSWVMPFTSWDLIISRAPLPVAFVFKMPFLLHAPHIDSQCKEILTCPWHTSGNYDIVNPQKYALLKALRSEAVSSVCIRHICAAPAPIAHGGDLF